MTKTSLQERIDWVDIFKAICILAMVMGHAGAPFITFIYMFHMPAFIFISGYTYVSNKYTFLQFVKRKALSILCPLISINLIYVLFLAVCEMTGYYSTLFSGEAINLVERLKMFFLKFSCPELGGATWFLLVLFTIEICFWWIDKLSISIKREWIIYLSSIVLSLIGWIMIKIDQNC